MAWGAAVIRPREGWSAGMSAAYSAGLAGEACPNGYAAAWAEGAAHRAGFDLKPRRVWCGCAAPVVAPEAAEDEVGYCEDCGGRLWDRGG